MRDDDRYIQYNSCVQIPVRDGDGFPRYEVPDLRVNPFSTLWQGLVAPREDVNSWPPQKTQPLPEWKPPTTKLSRYWRCRRTGCWSVIETAEPTMYPRAQCVACHTPRWEAVTEEDVEITRRAKEILKGENDEHRTRNIGEAPRALSA
jgi:hypothetical protein